MAQGVPAFVIFKKQKLLFIYRPDAAATGCLLLLMGGDFTIRGFHLAVCDTQSHIQPFSSLFTYMSYIHSRA